VIEPFICTRANPMTDALCRDAIPRGLRALHRLMDGGDSAAWDDMALTSLYGGLALANAGLGAVHGFAGVIGGRTGAAHGAICGALLVPVLRANRAAAAQGSDAAQRMDWVVAQIRAEFGHLQDFQNWIRGNGLPTIGGLGVTTEMHANIARDAVQSSSYRANPVDLRDGLLLQILAES
jgi:alcohol dehydrogenase class IV